MINELIEQIGGRERLEALASFRPSGSNTVNSASRDEWMAMSRAILAVLDAKTEFYIHRVEVCDTYGPEIELRAFNCQLDASKCRDDHGGEVIETYTAPPVASAPEWSNAQCMEFLTVAFRHCDISGDIEMDDIRLGVKMANAAAPALGDY